MKYIIGIVVGVGFVYCVGATYLLTRKVGYNETSVS